MQPEWMKAIERERRRGDELIYLRTGKRVSQYTKRELQEVLRDAPQAIRPTRLWAQDKSTLVEYVQRWATSEHGEGLIEKLRVTRIFEDVDA